MSESTTSEILDQLKAARLDMRLLTETIEAEILKPGRQEPALGLCLECCGRYKLAMLETPERAPELPRGAITLAPQVQPSPDGRGVLAVAAPVCFEHLTVARPTGLVLG